jgi:hypothetical protein
MKKVLTIGWTALLVSTAMLPAATSALAADAAGTVAAAPSNYGLTSDIRAAVKSVSEQMTAQGLQISATIRLYNGGSAQTRVPDHELHVQTADGMTYTLDPSAANKTALQPKEVAELVYMGVINRQDITPINSLSLVNVNEYTYPKTETTLVTFPAGAVWYGAGQDTFNKLTAQPWGQSFTLPGVNSDIQYTPVQLSTQTSDAGPVVVVTLLASNPAAGRETVPDFRVDAQSAFTLYQGKRAEQGEVALNAGEKKYVHFTIPVETGASPTSLLVETTDTFAAAGSGATTVIGTGKLSIGWPTATEQSEAAVDYTIGTPIAFDPLTKVIDKQTQVSLMELHMHENPGEGYKTVVAKFKLTNTGDAPVATPNFQTKLTGEGNVSYAGQRQASIVTTMNPGLSYVASYSFVVPQTESGSNLVLDILDPQAAAPYTTTVAALRTNLQADDVGNVFSLYPIQLKVNSVTVGYQVTTQNMYSYKIMLDLDITQQDNVVVDDNFSKLRFEIVDGLGRVLGSEDATFTGTNKLVSGSQVLSANNIVSNQVTSPVSVNVYEVIKTQNGEAKRLLGNFK